MAKITVSAPGKLMLLGEHAVLLGKPCIVTTVDQRLYLTAQFLEDKTLLNINGVKIPFKDLGNKSIPKEVKFVAKAVEIFRNKYPIPQGGLKITTRSQFSSKLGFGSSSAVTVCTLKALSILFDQNLNNKTLFDLSYKVVLDIQGKGSGFDVAAAIFGGTLYFVKGGKIIRPLDIKQLSLIIGYSGIKADTVTIINQVSQSMKKFPKIIKNIYDSIGSLINPASKSILQEDFETLGQLMSFNQGYLSSLGVNSQKLDNMINAAKDAGAYGAKLSGAGVGDCMIALSSPSKETQVKKAIKKVGGQIINIKTNVEGVRVEI